MGIDDDLLTLMLGCGLIGAIISGIIGAIIGVIIGTLIGFIIRKIRNLRRDA